MFGLFLITFLLGNCEEKDISSRRILNKVMKTLGNLVRNANSLVAVEESQEIKLERKSGIQSGI